MLHLFVAFTKVNICLDHFAMFVSWLLAPLTEKVLDSIIDYYIHIFEDSVFLI